MNYIIWKGQDSRTTAGLEGLIINELPPISKPKMRVQETEIDGVDGSIIEELGYEPYDKSIEISVKKDYKNIDWIINYFTGEGDIVFSNEPNMVYKAKIIDSIDFERLLRFKTAQVKFRVQPYKYALKNNYTEYNYTTLEEEEELPIIETITNRGYADAKPKITLRGTGAILFYLNGVQIFKYNFDEDGEVVIDSEKQDAYLGSVLKNRNMIGEFPILKSGTNEFYVEGNISYIKIENASRWL